MGVGCGDGRGGDGEAEGGEGDHFGDLVRFLFRGQVRNVMYLSED